MDYLKEIIVQIELHSVEGISFCFSKGVDPNTIFKGEPLIYELISEYTRTPRFKDCIKTFVSHGLNFSDEVLLAVLSDDASSLEMSLNKDPKVLEKAYTFRCAYTPIYEASLLHICAEFNHVACAEVLVKHGANVNAVAGTDNDGFGAQTPVFHAVNQNSNNSMEVLNYLLNQSADLKYTVPGIIWGKGYEWETLMPAVNPISYAMMGLLPQMHRDEQTISDVILRLLKEAYNISYRLENIPCAYLKKLKNANRTISGVHY